MNTGKCFRHSSYLLRLRDFKICVIYQILTGFSLVHILRVNTYLQSAFQVLHLLIRKFKSIVPQQKHQTQSLEQSKNTI